MTMYEWTIWAGRDGSQSLWDTGGKLCATAVLGMKVLTSPCWLLTAVFSGSDMETTTPIEFILSLQELKMPYSVAVVNVRPYLFLHKFQDHCSLYFLSHVTSLLSGISGLAGLWDLLWQQESGMDRRKLLIPLFKSAVAGVALGVGPRKNLI